MTDSEPETAMDGTTMTEGERTRTDDRPTVGDVSHTHPDTDEAFGAAMAYKRGPVVAADGGREPDGSRVGRSNGGERDAVGEALDGEREANEDPSDEEGQEEAEAVEDPEDPEADDDERMRNVEHVPPNDEDVNRVHQRGGEGSDGR